MTNYTIEIRPNRRARITIAGSRHALMIRIAKDFYTGVIYVQKSHI